MAMNEALKKEVEKTAGLTEKETLKKRIPNIE